MTVARWWPHTPSSSRSSVAPAPSDHELAPAGHAGHDEGVASDVVHPPVLVLLEGPSDVAAVTAFLGGRAGRLGHPAYEVVGLDGITNVWTHLRDASARRPAPQVLGLCDVGEARVVVRALQRVGRPVAEPEGLGAEGFFVCDRDLEDELIRALGPDRCLRVLHEQGLMSRFEAFSRQQAWAGRPLTDRLHRFCGIASGRKILLAGAMAMALGLEHAPPPLAALLERLEVATARPWGTT